MKVLFYISHPAQFHFFKNAVRELKKKNILTILVIKSKDVLQELIEDEDWDFINIESKERKKGRFFILWSLLKRDIKMFKICRSIKPDLLLGTGACITHIGKVLNIPAVTTLEDDYSVIKNLAKLTYPYSTKILAPRVCDVGKWQAKKIAYDGYMKLAYLHPNWFKPDRRELKEFCKGTFFLIRLSSLQAHHDFGIGGISEKDLQLLIKILEPHGSVFISSEKLLPPQFDSYILKLPISKIHHYIYYADILISDSQSMSVEAAILGTPCIRISDFAGRISVLEELEKKYQLTFGFKVDDIQKALNKLNELLNHPNLAKEFSKRRKQMLADKIDVSEFLIRLILNFPNSLNTKFDLSINRE